MGLRAIMLQMEYHQFSPPTRYETLKSTVQVPPQRDNNTTCAKELIQNKTIHTHDGKQLRHTVKFAVTPAIITL